MKNDLFEILVWKLKGKPVPPPHSYKRKLIRRYAKMRHAQSLIETGTYLGEMVEAMRGRFQKIISIEIEPTLYLKAKKMFEADPSVEIMEGDSGKLLPQILRKEILGPILFWLDGHFSGGITGKGEGNTPILKELSSIFGSRSSKGDIILIDDLHCFGFLPDYPSIGELESFIHAERPQSKIFYQDNIMFIENF